MATNNWVFFAKVDSTNKLDSLDNARKYKVGGYRGDTLPLYLKAVVKDDTTDRINKKYQ